MEDKKDKYHTTCTKCEATFAYLNGYKVHDNWYCGRCYRDMAPIVTAKVNRRGVWVDERSS